MPNTISTTGFLECHDWRDKLADALTLHDSDGMGLCLESWAAPMVGKYVRITIEEMSEPKSSDDSGCPIIYRATGFTPSNYARYRAALRGEVTQTEDVAE